MLEAIWVQEPAHVLIVAPNEQLPSVPIVHRVSHTGFMRKVGGQARYNRAVRRGRIRVVDQLRYDRTAEALLSGECDEVGRTRLAVHPALPFGLIWTMRYCGHLELAMRRMFTCRDDAERAAADVARLLERLGRETRTLAER